MKNLDFERGGRVSDRFGKRDVRCVRGNQGESVSLEAMHGDKSGKHVMCEGASLALFFSDHLIKCGRWQVA